MAVSRELPSHIWFVRSNGGSGSYPIRREGWTVVLKFVFGMFGWAFAAGALGLIGGLWGPSWIAYAAPFLFAAGAALSAWYFIDAARKHTDHSVTYNEYVKDKNNA